MSARVIRDFWLEYDEAEALECVACDWEGTAGEGSKPLQEDLFDVRCPECGQMLLIVAHPTTEDLRRAARRGVPEARSQLAKVGEEVPAVDHVAAIDELLLRVVQDPEVRGAVVAVPDGAYVQFLLSDDRSGLLVEAEDRDRWGAGHMTPEQIEVLEEYTFERTSENFQTGVLVDDLEVGEFGGVLAGVLQRVYGMAPDAPLTFRLVRP